MLISCVGAIMLRITTVLKAAFLAPQYRGFGTSVICEVVLYCLRRYGPLPAPVESAELNHCSALSALSAPTEAVAPWAFASFEFTIPVDVLARIAGNCVPGVFDRSTTVNRPFALAVTPSSRNAGLPFRLTRRLSENTTSLDVSDVPSANRTLRLSWKVKVFASVLAFQDCTSDGIGCAMSAPLYVKSVS